MYDPKNRRVFQRRPDPHPGWRDQAVCRGADPDLFFPTNTAGVVYAQQICATCPVQAACLNYALTAGEVDGVYGGTSARQRALITRERRRKRTV